MNANAATAPKYAFEPRVALAAMSAAGGMSLRPSASSQRSQRDNDTTPSLPGAESGAASAGGPPFDGMPAWDPRGGGMPVPPGPSGPFNLNSVNRGIRRDHRNAYREATDRRPRDFVKRALDHFAAERGLNAHNLYDVSEYLLWRNRVRNEATELENEQEQDADKDDAEGTIGNFRDPNLELGPGEAQQETHPWDFICTWAPKFAGPMRSAWNHWMIMRVTEDENAFLRGDKWHVWVSLACVKHSQVCATAGSGSSVMSGKSLHLSHVKNAMEIERALAQLNAPSANAYYAPANY